MRWWRLPALVLLAGRLDSQELDATVLLADLATRRDAATADAVRRHPASVANAVTVILERAHARAVPSTAQQDLAAAEWMGLQHADVWGDSSVVRGVRAFRGWSLDQRARKLEADRLRRHGNATLASSGVDAAMPHWRESLRIASSIPDASAMAGALGNIGAGFYRSNEPDSAQAYLERARRLSRQAGEIRIAANATTTLATLLLDRGQLGTARALYDEALTLHGRIGDVRGEVADRNNIGLVDQARGDLASARRSFEASLRQSRAFGLTDESGFSLMNLGNLDALGGNYAATAARYDAALAAYRATGNRLDGAGVQHNYGLMELRRGRYSAAADRLHESLVTYDFIGSDAQRVEVRNDLAAALLASGDLGGALSQLRRMDNLATRAPASSSIRADLALTTGEVAFQFNMLAESDRAYSRAETLYSRAENPAGIAAAREGRASLLLAHGDFAAARRIFEDAASVHARAGDRRSAGVARMLAGATAHKERRYALARRAIDQAVRDFQAAMDPVAEAAALGESASLHYSMGDLRRSELVYRRALQLVGNGAPPISWRLHAGLGHALRRIRPAEAAIELRRAVHDIESLSSVLTLPERRAAYLEDKWDVYAALAQLEARNGRYGAAFDVSERMRARQALDLLSGPPGLAKAQTSNTARGRELTLRRQIALLRSDLLRRPLEHRSLGDPAAAAGTSAAPSPELRAAQQRHVDVLRELETGDPAYAAFARGESISWREIATRLKPEETLVEYLVSDSTTLAFVVRRGGVRTLELAIGRRDLASAIDFSRGSLKRPAPGATKSNWRPPLRRLHRELIGPLERGGLLAGTQRLILIPHAELHYLPFAALIREGAKERFLVEQYDVEYAPSASVWVRLGERSRRQRNVDSRVLALAPRRRWLAGSSAEVAAIRAGYGTRAEVWTDAGASETRFRSAAGRYGTIHLATAGVLDRGSPLSSFIELRSGGGEDGKLEVHEVFGMSLSARLVVLSACETALASGSSSDVPAGDDWVGLTQAFLQAGADNVVGTLWRVDDRATARVMRGFYESLRSGRSESSSLAIAQRAAIRQPRTSDPFYWAGFVVSGAGGSDARRYGSRQ